MDVEIKHDRMPSRCEIAWMDCLNMIAGNRSVFTADELYQVMVDWARDLDRRGEARLHDLQRVAAERLGV